MMIVILAMCAFRLSLNQHQDAMTKSDHFIYPPLPLLLIIYL